MIGDHIHNTVTDMYIYADLNNGVHERGHYGGMTLFEWSLTDGVIENIYIERNIGEDLSLGNSGFVWNIVQTPAVNRAEALIAEAQSAPPPEPEAEPESA